MIFPRYVGQQVRVQDRQGMVVRNFTTPEGQRLIRIVFSTPRRAVAWCEPEEVEDADL